MLLSLHMENIAVIRQADVEFDENGGLCVLTGETGAGKSLLIDSLNALLGGRINRELLRSGEDKAFIGAVFSPPDPILSAALANKGVEIPAGDELLLQRTLNRDGRSVSRINGRPVTQGMIREIGSLLVNIHGQSDNQKLMCKSAHIALLDAYSRTTEMISRYRSVWEKYRQVTEQLRHLQKSESERLRLREMLEFQIRDIDSAALRIGEEEALIKRRDRLLHAEKIHRLSSSVCRALTDSERSTVTGLCDRAMSALDQLSPLIPDCQELLERLHAVSAEAEDISDSVRRFAGDADTENPAAELDRIEGRLDTIEKLSRKYGETVPAILAFRERAAAELDETEHADEQIAALTEEEHALHEALTEAASALTAHRQQAAAELSGEVQESLTFLDMPKVQFSVSVRPSGHFSEDGADDVEFLLSANPGEPLLPLMRIASGGELSRIMLAIRSVLNERYGVPTAVYDEVDTGISGRTARKVGIKLRHMAAVSQVICVTHSAQIASLATAHYRIAKREADGRAETTVTRLSETERVDEIARILGGLHVTDSQRHAARELMQVPPEAQAGENGNREG